MVPDWAKVVNDWKAARIERTSIEQTLIEHWSIDGRSTGLVDPTKYSIDFMFFKLF